MQVTKSQIRKIVSEAIENILKENFNIEQFVQNFKPVAIKMNDSQDSVLIKDENTGLSFWVDVWFDGRRKDVEVDWNQYMFQTNNSEDAMRKEIQENNDIFDMCSDVAIQYLEENGVLHQDDQGDWSSNKQE